MGYRAPFRMDPAWSFSEFLEQLYSYYTGGGIQSTGYRLNAMRTWLSMVGRNRAKKAVDELEGAAETNDIAEIAKSLWMSKQSYVGLRRFVRDLPIEEEGATVEAFISYRWESGEHVAWVRKLAADLRKNWINAILDQWEVKLGESFTTYMVRRIALQFEMQMMNARRIKDGVRIIGVYRSGDRPPSYLRDHKYVDFRCDKHYEEALQELVDDLRGQGGPPEMGN